jgi:hypothetical protein
VAAGVVAVEEDVVGRRYAVVDERDVDDDGFITAAAEAAAPLLPSPCSSVSIDAANSLNLLALSSSSSFEAPSPPSYSPLTDKERLEGRAVRGVAGEGCRRRRVANNDDDEDDGVSIPTAPAAAAAAPEAPGPATHVLSGG